MRAQDTDALLRAARWQKRPVDEWRVCRSCGNEYGQESYPEYLDEET